MSGSNGARWNTTMPGRAWRQERLPRAGGRDGAPDLTLGGSEVRVVSNPFARRCRLDLAASGRRLRLILSPESLNTILLSRRLNP